MGHVEKIVIVGFIVPLLLVLLLHPDKSAINYVPSFVSTDIESPKQWLSISIALVGLAGCFVYLTYRDIKAILIVVLLGMAIFNVNTVNTISRIILGIDKKQYETLHALIEKREDIISILPNYVDAKCEITYRNYEKISALALDPNATDIIKNLPIHMPTEQVKAMCKNTVFN